jgi:hypothetical protein
VHVERSSFQANVDVYLGALGRVVELSAVGDIHGKPEDVLGTLLPHTDPRSIATIAEGLLGTVARDGDFALSVRWTIQGAKSTRRLSTRRTARRNPPRRG